MVGDVGVPEVALTDFIFEGYDERIAAYEDRPWIVDLPSGTTVTFGQVKRDSMKIASRLSKRGFVQGDVLYFLTYELAHLYLVKLGVWMLGGAVRGCYQGEAPEVYTRQITESSAKFVLVDGDTIHVIQKALQKVDFEVKLLSLGKVKIEGTTHFSELLDDDSSAFVKPKIIDVRNAHLSILNTSGSTGFPKGVVHTHYTTVAYLTLNKSRFDVQHKKFLEFMVTYGIGVFLFGLSTLQLGFTLLHVTKFDRSEYFNLIMEHKPQIITMYPFVATWFSKCKAELEILRRANFLENIRLSGWMLDLATADLISQSLPNTHIGQTYATTEVLLATMYPVGKKPEPIKRCLNGGQMFSSSGPLNRGYEGKFIDVTTGKEVGPQEVGELYIRSPCNMLGYLTSKNMVDTSKIVEGWFQTGDIGFFDENKHIYIKDRASFIYKYKANFVLPNEIEATLLEHPDVQEAGVVGVPDLTSYNASRAFVVLKPGRECSAQALCEFAASKLPVHKQLHGGVRFVDKLPVNRGGKLDRQALKEMAMQEERKDPE